MPDRYTLQKGQRGILRHRVNLDYPNFYLDVVEVGRYVKIQHLGPILGPIYNGAIGQVIEIFFLLVGDERYFVNLDWGGGHTFYSHNIELLPADYVYRTIHEAAVRELGEDFFK